MEAPQEEGWRVNDMSTQERASSQSCSEISCMDQPVGATATLRGPQMARGASHRSGEVGTSTGHKGSSSHLHTQGPPCSVPRPWQVEAPTGGCVPCPVTEVAKHTPRLDPGAPAPEPAAGDLTPGGAEIGVGSPDHFRLHLCTGC